MIAHTVRYRLVLIIDTKLRTVSPEERGELCFSHKLSIIFKVNRMSVELMW